MKRGTTSRISLLLILTPFSLTLAGVLAIAIGCGDAEQPGPVSVNETVPPKPMNPATPATSAQPNAAPVADGNTTHFPEVGEPSKSESRRPRFQGWDDVQLVLMVTGRQDGYIEPCGCTGLANQKGGLARRHTLAKQLADKGWHVVALDVGNQVRRPGRQAEIKFQMTANGLEKISYQTVGFGPDDLRLSVDELAGLTASSDDQPGRFACANVAIYAREFTPQYRVVTAGDKKIGITSVLGPDEQKKIMSEYLVMQSAEDGLNEAWPKLKDENCDLYVLLAHASLEESKRLAEQFPHFDVVVTAGGGTEPELEPERISGTDSILVQVGSKGMYVGAIGVSADADTPLRYERIALDSSFEDSQDMLALLKTYQNELQRLGLDGLGLKPIPHPSGRQFLGSEVCADCHRKSYRIWKHGTDMEGEDGPHYIATKSLVEPSERVEIPRHYDPECLSCHVTGWNPQQFFPYETGYVDLTKSAHLHGNGCENCHGPASEHVMLAEELDAEDPDDLARIRGAIVRLTRETARDVCLECHDLDNSPDFHVEGAFDHYFEQIEHYED